MERLEPRLLLSVTMMASEQVLWYLVNRARSNPVAEAARYEVGLNDGLPTGDWSLISTSAKPPLAPNQSLVNASTLHSQDMLDRDYFDHDAPLPAPNGVTPQARANTAGYTGTVGENIFSASSWPAGTLDQDAFPYDAHADLFQSPGHRANMLYESYNEDGMGIRFESDAGGDTGMATELFGTRSLGPILVGVIFHDANGNGAYDIHEGLGGVTVSVDGTPATTTNAAGGWDVPVSAGTHTITASGAGFVGTGTAQVAVTTQNVEVDFVSGSTGAIVDFQSVTPPMPDTIGIFHSAAANWHLRNSNSSGAPDFAFAFGPPNWTPVTGDWNNDDVDTAGIFDATMGAWYLRDSNSAGPPDYTIGYGFPGVIPVTGDWNNDGTDTIGLYHPAGGSWYLRDSLSGGVPDYAIGFGFPGTIPVVGDWNNDGTDTIGLYHPAGGSWYLRDSLSGGAPDYAIGFGFPGTIPATGDWNGDGTDTIGLYHSDGGSWYLRDSLSGGVPDYAIGFGFPGVTPITGNWSAPLLAAEAAAPHTVAAPITDADLAPIVDEAIARWTDTGIDTSVLSGVDVVVEDISGNLLGLTSGNRVVIDVDAAGHGWYVEQDQGPRTKDKTGSTNDEVGLFRSGSRPLTLDSRLRMDLLTAVMHEMGHVLGYDHGDHGVMREELSPGIRHMWDELGDTWDDGFSFGF